MRNEPNTVERFNGEVYVFYAGPFYSDTQANQKVYSWTTSGEMSQQDNPVVYRKCVYVRSR
jgi:hypothetical protein